VTPELGSHVSNGTVAAHGCDSAIDDVVCNAVEDPGAAFRWRLNAVPLQICVPVGDDDPSRLGVRHVVVQRSNVVTNRRPAATLRLSPVAWWVFEGSSMPGRRLGLRRLSHYCWSV